MSNSLFDLTVITATFQRPHWLTNCCEQMLRQSLGNLSVEHLIISDGPDNQARKISNRYGARFHALRRQKGLWGAACKDFGIQIARGKYLVFFDDDNIYHPHALAALFAAVQQVKIGICQTIHGSTPIPRPGRDPFRHRNIDSMCFCVEREFAKKSRWRTTTRKGNDWHYLQGLLRFSPTYRVTPIVIGEHLT